MEFVKDDNDVFSNDKFAKDESQVCSGSIGGGSHQSNLTKQAAGTGRGRLGSYGVGELARISKEDRYEKFRQNSKEKFAHLNSLEKNESNYPNLSDGHDQRLSQQSDQISRSAVNSISGDTNGKNCAEICGQTQSGIFREIDDGYRENIMEIFRKAFGDSHYFVKAGREGLFSKNDHQKLDQTLPEIMWKFFEKLLVTAIIYQVHQ